MRRYSLLLVLGLIVALTLLPFSPAEPTKADSPAKPASKPIDDWKQDPVCKMVFFAVLEGLYEDGVSSSAVDSVVGKSKDAPAEIKATFVIQCPLCHPVYEAFRLYQQRPQFRDKGDAFGKGIDPKLETNLRSTTLRTRQGALQVLVHRWVERRLAQMGLSDEQKMDWARRLEERSKQGDDLLRKLRDTDSWYGGWGYGFCAACKGCTAVCNDLKTPKKK
jgi:hypothetical protein